MERSEKVGLGVAVAGHVVLFGLLSVGFLATPNPEKFKQQPIDVSLVKDVGLEATAPQAVEEPAPSVAPETGEPDDAAPPTPTEAAPAPEPAPAQAQPEPAPPKPAPLKPAPPEPAPKAAPKPKPAPKKPAPAPKPVEKPEPKPKPRPNPAAEREAAKKAEAAKAAAAKRAADAAKAKAAAEAKAKAAAEAKAKAAADAKAKAAADAKAKAAADAKAKADAAAKARGSGSASNSKSAKPRGGRLGDDFLKGLTAEKSTSKSQTPRAAKIDGAALASIVQAIARQIQPCADRQVDPGPGANEIVTTLNLKLNENGTLAATPTMVRQTGVNAQNERYAQRVRDLGIAAFKGCSPLKLPAEYYDTPNGGWNNINFKWKLR